jgi:hypothetical protein
MSKIIRKPIFWGGTALIVGAYFLSEGASAGAGQGLSNGLTIIAVAGGIALIIYAINSGT